MKITRLKFVIIFLFCAIAFLMATIAFLNQPAEQLLGSNLQGTWQATVSTVLAPIKIILVGPLLPLINFLRQDPDTPPPFFLVGFAFYWALLALAIYYVAGKFKVAKSN